MLRLLILTSRLALQKLRAILAKYIATAGRLIGEARLLKWFCEQRNVFFFISIAEVKRHIMVSRPRIADQSCNSHSEFAIYVISWINNNNFIKNIIYIYMYMRLFM